jgi:hypothetical protein
MQRRAIYLTIPIIMLVTVGVGVYLVNSTRPPPELGLSVSSIYYTSGALTVQGNITYYIQPNHYVHIRVLAVTTRVNTYTASRPSIELGHNRNEGWWLIRVPVYLTAEERSHPIQLTLYSEIEQAVWGVNVDDGSWTTLYEDTETYTLSLI